VKIKYFKSASGFRRWLEVNHARVTELWVGFFKKDSGKGGLTYSQALDEALCFGWIDGLKKRVDELSYTHRFTPRKPKSNWSLINLQHVERLSKAGHMMPAGLKAYAAREPERSGAYSFENAPRKLAAATKNSSGRTKSPGNFSNGSRRDIGGWPLGGWSARRNRRHAPDGWATDCRITQRAQDRTVEQLE